MCAEEFPLDYLDPLSSQVWKFGTVGGLDLPSHENVVIVLKDRQKVKLMSPPGSKDNSAHGTPTGSCGWASSSLCRVVYVN